MTDNITKLQDARVLKRHSLPLNTPITECTFSKEYTKHWSALNRAHTRFLNAMGEYVQGHRAGSRGKWKLMKRMLDGIRKEIQISDAFCRELVGGEQFTKVHNGTASEQDQHEAQMMSWFLNERALPFIEYWMGAFDVVEEEGVSLKIDPSDLPRWFDEEAA